MRRPDAAGMRRFFFALTDPNKDLPPLTRSYDLGRASFIDPVLYPCRSSVT